jgi:hypothetical protein
MSVVPTFVAVRPGSKLNARCVPRSTHRLPPHFGLRQPQRFIAVRGANPGEDGPASLLKIPDGLDVRRLSFPWSVPQPEGERQIHLRHTAVMRPKVRGQSASVRRDTCSGLELPES